ncbi:Hypothetical predicted protein [Octopus vulgaris]|uniref:CDAN1-interacting nuclease 1 n=1 Tax=Octopus vulgaris TaxID=6645 RepID=A0AA36BAA6_OCTVU|nr:Hypothetical predicted protein [Octopus vulgaris]
MKIDTYKKIVAKLKHVRRRDELPELCSEFPNVSIATMGSIYSQENQKKLRRTHHYHYNPKQTAVYYKKFLAARDRQEKHILYRMSEEADFSPSQLARIVLEEHLMVTLDKDHIPKVTLSKYLKSPLTIDDHVLSAEVLECIAVDDHYGPFTDCIKHAIGYEYEFELKKTLESLSLPYIGEEVMREKGYDKTPDIKLEIPIAVDGYIVNWIESKASFGDEFNHEIYLREQYWSYWNRFGAGMVIYWFGFIDELDVNKEKGIILKDSFPQNIVFFDPTGD